MPLWRCPHCGTPQAEAARCWVCRRSTTSCATCRHFRRGVTAQLGYCGLDRGRLALRGDEMRACWSAPATAHEPVGDRQGGVRAAPFADAPRAAAGGGRPGRTFVPVEEVATARPAATRDGGQRQAGPPRVAPAPAVAEAPRWSLWGEGDPQA